MLEMLNSLNTIALAIYFMFMGLVSGFLIAWDMQSGRIDAKEEQINTLLMANSKLIDKLNLSEDELEDLNEND